MTTTHRKKRKPAVGSRMPFWASDTEDGRGVVLAVTKYTGIYPQWFSWVVRLTAPRTNRGWIEMAY